MFRRENLEKIAKILQIAEKNEKTGKFFEAIEKYERAKALMTTKPLKNKKGFQKIKKKICELCNMLAIMFLQQNNKKGCFELLKKAEKNAKGNKKNLSLTFNNYACFYKSIGKYRVALSFLQEALLLEKKGKNSQSVSDIFLNICAVLSKLKRHKEAFHASLNSIVLIQEDLLSYCLPLLLDKNKEDKKNFKTKKINIKKQNKDFMQPKLDLDSENKMDFSNTKYKKKNNNKVDKEKLYERIIILSIAYHNLAVELEHLRLYDDSLSTYQKAYNFSKNILGKKTDVVQNLKEVLEKATKQLKEKLKNKSDKNQKREKKYLIRRKEICSAINKNQTKEYRTNKIYSAKPIRNYKINDKNRKNQKIEKIEESKESIIFDDDEELTNRTAYENPKKFIKEKNKIENIKDFFVKEANRENELSEEYSESEEENSEFENLPKINLKPEYSEESDIKNSFDNFKISQSRNALKKISKSNFSKKNIIKNTKINFNNLHQENFENKFESIVLKTDRKSSNKKNSHENSKIIINNSETYLKSSKDSIIDENKEFSKNFFEDKNNFFETEKLINIEIQDKSRIEKNLEDDSIYNEDGNNSEFNSLKKIANSNVDFKIDENKENFIDFSKFSQEENLFDTKNSLNTKREFAIDTDNDGL